MSGADKLWQLDEPKEDAEEPDEGGDGEEPSGPVAFICGQDYYSAEGCTVTILKKKPFATGQEAEPREVDRAQSSTSI